MRLSVGRRLRTLVCLYDADRTDVVSVEQRRELASRSQDLLVGTLALRFSLLTLAADSALTSLMHFMRSAWAGSKAPCSQRTAEVDISSGTPASSLGWGR